MLMSIKNIWQLEQRLQNLVYPSILFQAIGIGRRARGAMTPKFLEYLVILYFERQYPKQNTVACLNKNFNPSHTFGPDMPLCQAVFTTVIT